MDHLELAYAGVDAWLADTASTKDPCDAAVLAAWRRIVSMEGASSEAYGVVDTFMDATASPKDDADMAALQAWVRVCRDAGWSPPSEAPSGKATSIPDDPKRLREALDAGDGGLRIETVIRPDYSSRIVVTGPADQEEIMVGLVAQEWERFRRHLAATVQARSMTLALAELREWALAHPGATLAETMAANPGLAHALALTVEPDGTLAPDARRGER